MKTFFFFWRALALGPWPRAFLSLVSRVSVLGKAVLGLGFFCVLGLEPCVLDSTSAYNISKFQVSSLSGFGFFVSNKKVLYKKRKKKQINLRKKKFRIVIIYIWELKLHFQRFQIKSFVLFQLVFEVKRFKPPIDISVFLLGNSYHVTDCLQNLRVVVSYIPYLRFKVEVSTSSAFLKLERFRALIAEFVNFQGKN